jgi:Mg2+ and Co2+ transporter CorA
MKSSALPLFFLMMGCLACSPSPEKKVETLQQEVLALHDSAMANMGTLYTHRKELTYLRDSVVVQDTLAQRSLTKGIAALVLADEQMMQWMRAYRNPEGKPAEEALTYLQQEKDKIEEVRQVIAQSLRSADSLNSLYRNTSK